MAAGPRLIHITRVLRRHGVLRAAGLAGGVSCAALVVAGALLAGVAGWHRTLRDVLIAMGLAGIPGGRPGSAAGALALAVPNGRGRAPILGPPAARSEQRDDRQLGHGARIASRTR